VSDIDFWGFLFFVQEMYNYCVTAQKSTAVSHCAVGHFTSTTDLNLIIVKNSRIEIHLMTHDGLQPMLDVGVYGRLATVRLFHSEEDARDLLFLSSERFQYCVLAFDTVSREIVTRATGSIEEKHLHVAEGGPIAIIDMESGTIGMYVYEGSFRVISIDKKGAFKESFNIRMEELTIIDMAFLYGCRRPTICLLFQDTNECRHIKTYELSTKEHRFEEGPWQLPNVEDSASLVIPVKVGGAIIIGEKTIAFRTANGIFRSIEHKNPSFTCWAPIDEVPSSENHFIRYLLADGNGILSVLVLVFDVDNQLSEMNLEPLGETSIASCVSYLDNGVVFIGSRYGDSQLIKLKSEKDENGFYLEHLESITNIGPIVDFVVVDLERQGQSQIIACSGAFKDGSLRIIRNGIGIIEQATAELSGIKGLWSLRASSTSEYDKFVILSFVAETRILAINGEELEEIEISGFHCVDNTVHAATISNDRFLQVTPRKVILVDAKTFLALTSWSPPDPAIRISSASSNANQIVLNIGGGQLVYIEIEGDALQVRSQKQLEHEISCLSLHPLGQNKDQRSDIVAVGMWTDITVRLLSLPSLEILVKENLGGEIIPRSVLLISFEDIDYLLCGLGDGHLCTFVYDRELHQFHDKKTITLGTQPLLLNTFRSGGAVNVLVSSDRPAVVYGSNKKLVFSNVNLKETNHMCGFHSESFPDSLAFANENSLTIGTIDSIQKLHIRTIPLGEMPRRIAYQEASKTIMVATQKLIKDDVGNVVEEAYLRLLDIQTFEVIYSYPLETSEMPCSIISCTFLYDSNAYYIIGTAIVLPDEGEPSCGHIKVFQVVSNSLHLITQIEMKGAVTTLNSFNGKLLAGVNSKVQLLTWQLDEYGVHKLIKGIEYIGHIWVLCIETRGDFIIVGDLMRSVSLLLYKSVEDEFEEIARDFSPNWMTAVEIIDDDIFLGSENFYNLFSVKRNSDAATDEERSRLENCGRFHLGEFVNKFREGSLVRKTDSLSLKTHIYGCISGVIGVVVSLDAEQYNFFWKVQQVLQKVICGVGEWKHNDWRSFCNDRITYPSMNFVDGDLIESFLDLNPSKRNEVANMLEVPVEVVVQRIEAIQQATH